MMPGLDVLGGVKFSELCIHNWPTGFAAGTFLDKFGPADKFIEDLFATGRNPRHRVQIVYEDDHHYYSSRHDDIIIRGIHRLNRIKEKFPQYDLQASPFCEHSISGAALKALWDKVKKEAKGLTLVNNPGSKGAFYPDMVNEVHSTLHNGPGIYNFSYDGLAAVDSNVTAFKNAHSKALTFFLWEPRFNGLWESPKPGDKRPPIATRNGYPNNPLFLKSIAFLASDKGITQVPPHWLIKSHAENHGKGDPKAEHLCIIVPPMGKKPIDLVCKGKILAHMPYYGTYEDGRHRYYANAYGYQISQGAISLSGSPICDVIIEGKIKARINAGFRDGEWKNK